MGENDIHDWNELEVLFEEALTLAPERRPAFLEEVRASDPALGTELASLLSAHDEASGYFDHLADDLLPSALQDLHQRSARSSRVDQTVGPYRVVDELGRGGMGVVYKARDTRLDRFVALKFLPPHLSTDETSKQRFIQEAKAASSLDHPNICTIYEISESADGQLYIAMAYYDGKTLTSKIARDPLSVEDAVAFAAQMAEGLAHAHAHDIIHRDVKPGNVLVTPQGQVKILDFGLAKVPDIGLTRTGMTMGTVSYMSPEQVRGDTVDARTDLWSLGVVLYEMLTGERPFDRGREPATLYAIQHGDPRPLSEHRGDVPPALQGTIEQCLERDVEARPATATDLRTRLNAVQRAMATASTDALPVPRRTAHHPTWVLRAALLTVGIAMIALIVWAVVPAAPPTDGGPVPPSETGDLPPPVPTQNGIVVLPCTEASQDPSGQALCTGLMTTLTHQLSDLQRRLGVWVVPADELRNRGTTTLTEARDWYDADLVLTGSVARADDRIQVDLALLDETGRRPVATDAFSLPSANATVLQREAPVRVARMLGVEMEAETLGASLLAGSAVLPQVYQRYLEGLGHLWQHRDTTRLAAARHAFGQALAADTAYAPAHAGLGESYWHTYQTDPDPRWLTRAEQHADRALALDDRLARAHHVRGTIARHREQYDRAEQSFLRVQELHPDRADVYHDLARVYVAQGNLDKAESTLTTVVYRWPEYWYGYYDLGNFYGRQGRFEAAVAQLRQAVEAAPNHFRPLSNLAAYYQKMGRLEEARTMYERLIDVKPNVAAYSNLGTMYFDEGRYADAAAMYKEALSLDADYYALWGNLAEALLRAGDRDRALAHFETAAQRAEERLAAIPNNTQILSHLSGYYAALDRPDRAVALLERALDEDPTDVEVMYRAATTYEQLGMRDRALTWIERALERGYPQARIERDPVLRDLRSDPRYRDRVANSTESPS